MSRGRTHSHSGGTDPSGSAEGVRPGALSEVLHELERGSDPGQEGNWEQALRPGAVIGRFELIREVGHGGFGVVYEARDTELGRLVAFKAVRSGPRQQAREQRILWEAEAAARLCHPNIVTLFDVGRAAEGPYLVMELLRGCTLARRLEQGCIPLPEALRIGIDVAKGLAHAHAQGVIHRDLTPGNIFLRDDGEVKILDLGLAHAFGHRKIDGGTPAYMAPEQWRDAPEDERTDVFAMGVILFKMITGNLPFSSSGERPLIPTAEAPPLDVPESPALAGLVARMLAHDPVQRPRDAGEVVAVLTMLRHELDRVQPGDTQSLSASRGRRVRRAADSAPTPTPLDAAAMTAIESRAALILGPIAHHLVRTVAVGASTPRELAYALAAFMPASVEREDFLRSCPPTSSGPEAATPAVRSATSSSAFSADVLERAGRQLATYVGPMASILVSRAAAKAASEDELYDLLAAEIVSPRDREVFRRARSPSQPRRG